MAAAPAGTLAQEASRRERERMGSQRVKPQPTVEFFRKLSSVSKLGPIRESKESTRSENSAHDLFLNNEYLEKKTNSNSML